MRQVITKSSLKKNTYIFRFDRNKAMRRLTGISIRVHRFLTQFFETMGSFKLWHWFLCARRRYNYN